ncbi:MAG: dienelactone hydrolase family protein [Armatimonadetes bacterium]|nr:dienelactone hydrolase family protein [Armatimonadota bacterium]
MKPTRRQFLQAGLGALLTGPVALETLQAAAPAAADAPLPPPHVGSLYPLIQKQADRARHPYSFLNRRYTSLAGWQSSARKRIRELLLYRPVPVSPQAEILERSDRGDYWRESVRFRTAPDVTVPAFVLIPKTGRPPYPAVVALHDHGAMYRWGKEKICEVENEPPVLTAFKQECYGGRSYASDLARAGYLVISIDAFYFGQRRLLPADYLPVEDETPEDVSAFNAQSSRYEELMARTLFTAGITWPGVLFWDDIRTVDYLAARPDVDPKRIGCIGLSIGGFRSAHLAALDARIKTAVVVGWMSSYGPMIRSHILNHTWMIYVPGLYQSLDLPDIVSLTAPNPLLVIHGTQDTLFPLEGVRSAFRKIQAAYTKAGFPDRFHGSYYDRPHEFNRAMQTEAFAWLKNGLA